MSEYIIHYKDAETLYEHTDFPFLLEEYLREPIVRCRDCKYIHHEPDWQPDKRRKPFDLWLCGAEWCEGIDGENPWVNPNGFCAWGERRA